MEQGFIPPYFLDVPELLASLPKQKSPKTGYRGVVGGGTDLYVQRPEKLTRTEVQLVSDKVKLNGIRIKGKNCRIGASSTVTDLLESEDMNRIFPNLKQHLKLVSSTQIRNMGTVAGNLANASPIGDLTVFLLALNASVTLKGKNKHNLPLREFYLGYKKLNKDPDDIIKSIEFPLPGKATRFNFEKVCKRTHLDIASVNSAIQISETEGRIRSVSLAAGGIGPIPAYLAGTCQFLKGKKLSAKTVKSAAKMLTGEISPISDARGSASYKSLLLRQLFFAHFLELFPDQFDLPDFL
ncbi:MAG: FAD binding domain-containing protein [Verrucomicrobiales bacterium]|nr:FAD binding domain-containing protein [Verrucomicrobiales bacterium]